MNKYMTFKTKTFWQDPWLVSLFLLSVMLALVIAPDLAFSQGGAGSTGRTLGGMLKGTYYAFAPIQNFLSWCFYIGGIFFMVSALNLTKKYVDSPDDVPLNTVLLRYGAAGLMIAAPYTADMIVSTIANFGVAEGDINAGGNAEVVQFTQGTRTAETSGGPDEIIIRLATDLWGPIMDYALPLFCYVAGLIFMLFGLKRLAVASKDGPQAPGSMGTFGVFFLAAALMSVGYMINIVQGSMFGTSGFMDISLADVDDTVERQADNVLWGVFTFLRIFGYISFIRGLFLIKGVTEGAQGASVMAASTHIIAGAMLANIGAFVDVLQTTFITDPDNYVFNFG